LIWHDDGNGVTEESLSYFREHRDRIGDVWGVTMLDYKDRYVKYPLRIQGALGEVWLSGCRAGYGGEGPHGTHVVLQELGYSEPHTRYPFERSRFELGPPFAPDAEEYGEPEAGLTEDNLAVLRDIREFYEVHGRTPGITEMPGSSLGSIYWHLRRLEQAGKIKRESRKGIIWFEGMEDD